MNNGSERTNEFVASDYGYNCVVAEVDENGVAHIAMDPSMDEMRADLLVQGSNSLKELAGDLLVPLGEPNSESKYKEPVMHYEPAEGTGGLPAIICTCGKAKHHLRRKILQRWAEKHTLKTGHQPVPWNG